MFGKTLKTIPKVIHTGRKRLRAERTRFNTLKVINIIYKEFDPGSGRTLAACLTHASRTEKAPDGALSCERSRESKPKSCRVRGCQLRGKAAKMKL